MFVACFSLINFCWEWHQETLKISKRYCWYTEQKKKLQFSEQEERLESQCRECLDL